MNKKYMESKLSTTHYSEYLDRRMRFESDFIKLKRKLIFTSILDLLFTIIVSVMAGIGYFTITQDLISSYIMAVLISLVISINSSYYNKHKIQQFEVEQKEEEMKYDKQRKRT